MRIFCKFLLVSVLALYFHVPEALAAKKNPQRGKELYAQHCAVCHGPGGKGDGYLSFHPPVSDLTSPDTQHKSDYELWKTVHQGGSNPVMETWQWVLSEKDIALVLAYIRTLPQ